MEQQFQTEKSEARDIDGQLERLYSGKMLLENDVKTLCEKVKELLMSESNVQHVKAPVNICGDIHG